jgi:GT2 family glycosyltransferase
MSSVAIIIPSYNTKDLTLSALQQISNIKIPGYNIVPVMADDCSTDGSAEFVKKEIGDRLNMFKNSSNKGFTKTINKGIAFSILLYDDIEYFIFLNSDIKIVAEDVFSVMIDGLKKYEEFGCIIPEDAIIGQNLDKRKTMLDDVYGYTDEGMWYCVAMSRITIQNIGLLDEQFVMHASDSDYQTRIRKAGLKIGFYKHNSGDKIYHLGFRSSRVKPGIHDTIKKDQETWKIKRQKMGW